MQIMVKDAYAFGDDGGEDDYEDAGPSKSEIKRQMLALQDLGKKLTTLSPEALARLPLSDSVRAAVKEYQKIRTFKAQQRHIQHIGKLLRQDDSERILKALEDASGKSAAVVAIHHQCEKLRSDLLTSDSHLTELAEKHPELNLQKLRQAVRQARKEAAKEDPATRNPKSYREIYQMLHDALMTSYRDAQDAAAAAEENQKEEE